MGGGKKSSNMFNSWRISHEYHGGITIIPYVHTGVPMLMPKLYNMPILYISAKMVSTWTKNCLAATASLSAPYPTNRRPLFFCINIQKPPPWKGVFKRHQITVWKHGFQAVKCGILEAEMGRITTWNPAFQKRKVSRIKTVSKRSWFAYSL